MHSNTIGIYLFYRTILPNKICSTLLNIKPEEASIFLLPFFVSHVTFFEGVLNKMADESRVRPLSTKQKHQKSIVILEYSLEIEAPIFLRL